MGRSAERLDRKARRPVTRGLLRSAPDLRARGIGVTMLTPAPETGPPSAGT